MRQIDDIRAALSAYEAGNKQAALQLLEPYYKPVNLWNNAVDDCITKAVNRLRRELDQPDYEYVFMSVPLVLKTALGLIKEET